MASSGKEKRNKSADAEPEKPETAAPETPPAVAEAVLPPGREAADLPQEPVEPADTPEPGMTGTPPDLSEEALPDQPSVLELELPESRPDPEPQPESEPQVQVEPVPQAEAVPPIAPARPADPPERRGILLPLVLGGAIAAGLGFGGAYLLGQNGWIEFGQQQNNDEVLAALQAQSQRMQDLEQRLTGAQPDLSGIQQGQQTLLAQLAALEQRLGEIEARPPTPAEPADLSGLEGEVAELRALLAQGRQDAAALETEAQARAAAEAAAAEAERAARETERRAHFARLQAALNAGEPFAEPLEQLQATGMTVPETLQAAAESGVPSREALRQSFPQAARPALAAALEETAGDAPADRVQNFLRAQLGVRSLAPREGDDPDAVLSRAEAAVTQDDLATALAELEALPPQGRAQMAGWIEDAQARLAAEEAVAGLSDTLSAN